MRRDERSKTSIVISGRFLGILVRIFGFFSKKHHVYISRGSVIRSVLSVEEGVRVNGPISIRGRGRVTIGKYCAIGDGVKIITQNHDVAFPIYSLQLQKKVYGRSFVVSGDVEIGHNVWIGDNVLILPGVKIASNSIVAAGSVVSKNVDSNTLVGGVPAKFIKKLHEDSEGAMSDEVWESGVKNIVNYLTSTRK